MIGGVPDWNNPETRARFQRPWRSSNSARRIAALALRHSTGSLGATLLSVSMIARGWRGTSYGSYRVITTDDDNSDM